MSPAHEEAWRHGTTSLSGWRGKAHLMFEHDGVVHEPIQDGGHHDSVTEDLAPRFEWEIARLQLAGPSDARRGTAALVWAWFPYGKPSKIGRMCFASWFSCMFTLLRCGRPILASAGS